MESKTDKPAPKDDNDSLKTLAMPELMKKLGASPEGLTQAEAKKRQAQYGPNQIAEKKTNEFLKFLTYFWGPIPWMIEGAVILSGRRPPLARFLGYSSVTFLQRAGRILGRASGRE